MYYSKARHIAVSTKICENESARMLIHVLNLKIPGHSSDNIYLSLSLGGQEREIFELT